MPTLEVDNPEDYYEPDGRYSDVSEDEEYRSEILGRLN
jgi:hypothetical protein